jgi:hypothetical protein
MIVKNKMCFEIYTDWDENKTRMTHLRQPVDENGNPLVLAKEGKEVPTECDWGWTDIIEGYETSCNDAFSFVEGGLKENEFKHCPFCGKVIKEK